MENTVKLSKHNKINNHTITLEKNKQPLFNLIYSLQLIELETLKIYIKTNLANNLIWPLKSLTKTFILFNQKLNKNFRFYIDY